MLSAKTANVKTDTQSLNNPLEQHRNLHSLFMKDLEEVAYELSSIGQCVCAEVGISEMFSVFPPKGMTDHYAFTGFLGETPLFFGINGRGNAVREYIPEILDAIKKHLTNTPPKQN